MTILLTSALLYGQDLKTFSIYNKEEQPVTFAEMIRSCADYDVVLFGEYHNNAIIHWLQLKTEQALYAATHGKLIVGAEMFERDNQEAVDRYLSGETDEKKLAEEARLWNNFKTDYKPLLDFAKEHQLPFIATNVPRRYASRVAKNSLDSLSHLPDSDKVFIARLPIKVDIETPGYKGMLDMMQDHAGEQAMHFVAAQAIKDATMAESILKNVRKGYVFLHFQGDYHSKEYGGIYWYLKKSRKKLKVAVISVVESDTADLLLPADFIATEFNIVVPADMTKTY